MQLRNPHQPQTTRARLAKKRGGVFNYALNITGSTAYWMIDWLTDHFQKHYAGKYRHAKHLFALDLILSAIILFLAAGAIWVIFLRTTIEDKIHFTVRTQPTELISGAPASFTVEIKNTSRENLTEAVLAVRLPRHFELERTFPREFVRRTSSLPLGTLRPGEVAYAKFAGRFWGPVGEKSALLATLAMTQESRGSRHLAFRGFNLPVAGSVLTADVLMPDRAVLGQAVPYTLEYRNTGNADLENIFFEPRWPAGTLPVDSVPAIREGKWRIEKIEAGRSGEITGVLRPPGQEGETANFGFQSFIIKNGETLAQGYAEALRALIASPLVLTAVIEGTPDAPLEAGSTVRLHITATNRAEATLKNINLGIETKNPFVEESSLPAATIIEQIGPGQNATISLSLALSRKPRIVPNEPLSNSVLQIRPTGSAILTDGAPLTIESFGPALLRKIITPFAALAAARYWTPQGDQIGRGILPPAVGEATKYWIFWQLEPTTSAIENLSFRTILPPEAEWTGRSNVTVGAPLEWNPSSRTVGWNLGNLKATAGTGLSVFGRFEVALTPTAPQVGTTPVLIGKTLVRGQDSFTDTELLLDLPAITTELPSDRRARGLGVVTSD